MPPRLELEPTILSDKPWVKRKVNLRECDYYCDLSTNLDGLNFDLRLKPNDAKEWTSKHLN